jgi:hypothetical protein
MKRTLLLIALLSCPVAVQAQHLVDGVNLPDVIKIIDNDVPGFTPVTLTWNATTARWSSPAGQFPRYHFHLWDDEHGEHYVIGVERPGGELLDAASEILSRTGIKPLVLRKKSDFGSTYTIQ